MDSRDLKTMIDSTENSFDEQQQIPMQQSIKLQRQDTERRTAKQPTGDGGRPHAFVFWLTSLLIIHGGNKETINYESSPLYFNELVAMKPVHYLFLSRMSQATCSRLQQVNLWCDSSIRLTWLPPLICTPYVDMLSLFFGYQGIFDSARQASSHRHVLLIN